MNEIIEFLQDVNRILLELAPTLVLIVFVVGLYKLEIR